MLISVKRDKNSSYRVIVELIDNTGGIMAIPRQVSRFDADDVKWMQSLGSDDLSTFTQVNAELLEICSGEEGERGYEVEEDRVPKYLTESNTEETAPYFTCILRDLEQPKHSAIEIVDKSPELAFKCALEYETELREPVIEWTDTKAFICLDIDYHELPFALRPTEAELVTVVRKLSPLPYCWHMSHGRGAKLYYASKPGFTAEELASVAALMWVTLDPRATFDIIRSTRHPLYRRTRDSLPAPCKTFDGIKFTHGCGDVSALKRLMSGELSDEDTTEFLQSRGWTIGQTLPHSECPINPSDETKQTVFIGDAGVYCHKCAAKGLGSSRAGFVGFNVLAGSGKFDGRLYRVVRNFVHLEHASVILSTLYPSLPPRLLHTTYRVLLKCIHGHDDPRIGMAMYSGKGFIRVRGQWVSSDGEHVLAKNLAMFVKSLPAVLTPREDELGINVPAFTAFQNSNDLTEYGYEDISLIRGCKIYGQFLPTPDVTKVIVRREFKDHTPQYAPLSKRMDSTDAWGLLEEAFPGIDKDYVRLLIASKGSSEGRLSQCPYLLIAGPSGSGKSTTVQIAAGICGDKSSEPIFVPNIERFRQSMMDSARESGFVLVNEIFKHAKQYRLTPTQALDPMLSMTEDSRSHVMYVGSVPFGRLPVFILTDISIPPEVEQDLQLSRRFTYYRLKDRNYWSDTFVQKRIRPHEFRLISADHNSAADAILSEVIDRWFRVPTALEDIAASLGMQTLQIHNEEIENTGDKLRLLYEEVCKAPPLFGADAQRYQGAGWKRVDRITDSRIRALYEEFCDGLSAEQWGNSRLLQSEDWKRRLGLKLSILCEIKHYRGQIVYIRFRSTDSARRPEWVNGEFLK